MEFDLLVAEEVEEIGILHMEVAVATSATRGMVQYYPRVSFRFLLTEFV